MRRRTTMTTTERLITELQQDAETDGSWTISADELADRYDPVDFYRAVYETGQVSTDVYGPENAGELLVLLERLAGRDYREEFREAGLFLSHEDRIELTERFVRTVRHAIVVHVPEPETFRAMIREFRRYDRAEFIYLTTFFDAESLVERCTREYVRLREAPALAATVRAYLRLLLQRHIVDVRELAPALMEILRTVARHEGRLPGWDEESDTADDAIPVALDERASALRTLGISTAAPSTGEIRDHYRRLMRRYHPDINPEGLEMAKAINHAYGILVTAAQDG
jgi:hypothetical protein